MKKQQTNNILRVLLIAVLDLLLIGAILLSFAFFHHVLPAIRAQQESQRREEQLQQTQPTTEPSTTAPHEEPTTEATTLPAVTEPEVTESPIPKTEWQIKFADKFTDEVVVTENSYTSPYVSITIEKVSYGKGWGANTYFIADVYVASLDNFKTATAHNEMRYFSTQNVLEMVENSGAILAISGDFYAYQATGFLMRNGFVYKSDPTFCDVCVLYEDGVMETYSKNGYSQQKVLDRGAVQVWNFGPNLLDENGKACKSFNMDDHVAARNPRSAIGYYEPGHYCLVVVDGREYDYAAGVLIPDLAKIFEGLGCKVAYNLDGGGSAVMTFNGAIHSVPSEERDLSDLVIVVDGPPAQQED